MDRKDTIAEDTRRTLAAALSLWSLTVALAGAAGAFARLDSGEFAALALFATAFALATARLDARVRATLAAWPASRLAAVSSLAALALAIAVALAWGRPGEPLAALAAFPRVLAPLVALPAGAVLGLAALGRATGERAGLSPREAKAPATNPAAT